MAIKTVDPAHRPTLWNTAQTEITALVRAAAGGDETAWRHLVARYNRLVWAVARRFRLGDEQTADLVQSAWLRLIENIGAIRDPERLPGWLVRTTTRLGIAAVHAAGREERLAMDGSIADTQEGPEVCTLRLEQRAIVALAISRLPHRDRTLLHLLVVEETSYDQICRVLAMPRGSIGPNRARALRRLRSELESLDVIDAAIA